MINELRLRGGWMFVLGWAMVFASLPGPMFREPFIILPHTPAWLIVIGAAVAWSDGLDLKSALTALPDVCLLASPLLFWVRPRRILLNGLVRGFSVGLLVPWLLLVTEDPAFHGRPILDDLMWGYYVFSTGCTLIFIACVLGRPVTKALMIGRGFPIEPISTRAASGRAVQALTGE